MIEVGIIGASGYTGGELLRFLKNHSEVEIVASTSRKHAEIPIEKVHPHLQDLDMKYTDISPE